MESFGKYLKIFFFLVFGWERYEVMKNGKFWKVCIFKISTFLGFRVGALCMYVVHKNGKFWNVPSKARFR
jgi:hypothetical protein